MSLQNHTRQPEFALLIVVVRVVEGSFADEELRHIIVEELVEMVRTDHDQYVGPGLSKRLAVGLYFAYPLISKVGPAFRGRSAGAVEEGMVGSSEDSDNVGHNFLLR